jgi:hypothetical protein
LTKNRTRTSECGEKGERERVSVSRNMFDWGNPLVLTAMILLFLFHQEQQER